MDEQLERSLRDQEQQLRGTIAVFSRAIQRVGMLGDSVGWVGPASAAYDAAINTLRAELRMAELHLNGALRDTMSAITVGENSG